MMPLLLAAIAASTTGAFAGTVAELRASPPDQVLEQLSGDSLEGASFLRAEALLRSGRIADGLSAQQAFQAAFPGSILQGHSRFLEASALLLGGEHLRGFQILSDLASGPDTSAARLSVLSLRDWIRSGHAPESVVAQLPYLWTRIDDTTLRAATQAVSGRPLVAMLPLTGPYAQIGKRVAKGAQLAAQETRTPILVVDEPSDPIQAALLMRGILRVAKPRALVGPLLSNTASAVALEMAKSAADVPMILPAATSPGVSSLDPSAWQINITTSTQGAAAAALARGCLQSAETYLLWPKTEFGESVSDGFRQEFARLGGRVAWQRSYQAGTNDFRPLLESLRRTAFDLARRRGKDTAALGAVVFVPSESPSEALALGAQASQMGLKIRWIGASGWHSRQFLVETQGRLDGTYIVTDNIPDESRPAWKAFAQKWRSSEGDAPDRLAALGWDATQIAVQSPIPAQFQGAQADIRLDYRTRVNRAVGLLKVDKGAFVPANCPGP
jgi:branched-chain amino acid transport system substrate-binding protein